MKWCILLFTAFLFAPVSGQNTHTVKGSLSDTLGNPLVYGSIFLLEKSDSTMIDFTRTSLDGSFKFNKVASGQHLIKTSFIGFIPVTLDASDNGSTTIDLGKIEMVEMASELMEVVIKTAKAPILMRGDTIEYDASTFQVPDGSTVEALLKQLPGIEVDQDGSIKAEGQDVTEVTVDGKTFFGADPKMATKNLPAEGISKVQVFNKKTEEEEVTGGSGESTEKTMNLELKEEFKKGGFGKLIAGIGTENLKEIKGNYNKFNDKIQFSLVGVGNNTGRNGLGWDDYQDFLGSNAFSFGDGGVYGFGRGNHFTFGGGSGGIESSIQSAFFGGGGTGLPENYNGGLNFNYDHNKTKIGSVYYYNQKGLTQETTSVQDKFFGEFVQNEDRTSLRNDVSKGHRIELKLEKELDSLHTLLVNVNGAYVDEFNSQKGDIALKRNDALRSSSQIDNSFNSQGYLMNGSVLFRKKFMKKGRRMGVNVAIMSTELSDQNNLKSTNQFFEDSITTTNAIWQTNEDQRSKRVISANALYVEPIMKKFTFNTFYNYNDRYETGERFVDDIVNNESIQNASLTRGYKNTVQSNRIGSYLNYSNNGTNLKIGLAYQHFNLVGIQEDIIQEETVNTIDRTFMNYIPHVSFRMNPTRTGRITLTYSRDIDAPQIGDLQPLVDNRNPFLIRIGNPNLNPTVSNNARASFWQSFPASRSYISVGLNTTLYSTRITTSETVNENLITTIAPINLDGGQSFGASARFSGPIWKTFLTFNAGFSIDQSYLPVLVNEVTNNTTNSNVRPSFGLTIKPVQSISFASRLSFSQSTVTYDITESQNQVFSNLRISTELDAKVSKRIFFNASFNYRQYSNDRFNVEQAVPILNASINRQFFKKKTVEGRLSIYDAFNQNIGINQGATGIGFSRSETQVIGRYIMGSITYNMRGVTADMDKRNRW